MSDVVAAPKVRLHYIDWIRVIMVCGVVYVHLSKTGIYKFGLNDEWHIDDHNLWAVGSFRAQFPNGSEAQPFQLRWITIARQWCLPLLFWVSGASIGCSYRGGFPKGIPKILTITAVGVVSNALVWVVGPMDENCPFGAQACASKGLLFNFTIAPYCGYIFPIVYQMWYTMMLVVMMIVNWPMFEVSYGSLSASFIIVQWALLSAIYGTGLFFIENFGRAYLMLVLLEALFCMTLVIERSHESRPSWLPTRVLHYILGTIVVLQFGAVPYSEHVAGISFPFVLYLLVGFNRMFCLGFILVRARLHPDGDQAAPLLSRLWPAFLFFGTLVLPSTNWNAAGGNVTYPYFQDAADRVQYVLGAVCLTFLIDRWARGLQCDPVPEVVTYASAFLYIFHPGILTLFITLGISHVIFIWVLSIGVALAFTAAVMALMYLRQSSERREDPQYRPVEKSGL
mmetsp:Transcript_30943/g.82167  ORF Transcript_30943/g.82167 Transcript_30943/m.82167 type:complete len:453 (-) Transcript_30943:14-1372(-)